jgi:hypothetical protein
MSARKLARFAGLLIALSAMFAAGVGATGAGAAHTASHSAALPHQDLEIIWG